MNHWKNRRSFSTHLIIAALMLVLLAALSAISQETLPMPNTVDPELSLDDDSYMNRQADAFLKEVDAVLLATPPQYPEPDNRRLALRLLDAVLHDIYAPNRVPLQSFYHERMERVAAELETTKVRKGATIWKLYNHGFIVRTASVTLAFDVHRGASRFRVDDPQQGKTAVQCPGFPMSDAWAESIARQCDALFISHKHGDHADPGVAQAFLALGKPVVAPVDVFEGNEIQAKVTHLERITHEKQTLRVKDGSLELGLVVYPGQQYQGEGTLNNVVLVFTPEGMSFAHNGDEINDPYPDYQEDFKWIDAVHEHHKVDVLMTNCWSNDILRQTRGFDPKLVLPGHQNELGHPIWDRVPYWGDAEQLKLNLFELPAEGYPIVTMTWGESYRYVQKTERARRWKRFGK